MRKLSLSSSPDMSNVMAPMNATSRSKSDVAFDAIATITLSGPASCTMYNGCCWCASQSSTAVDWPILDSAVPCTNASAARGGR